VIKEIYPVSKKKIDINIYMNLVNTTNAHTGGFLSSNEGAFLGCGGKGAGVTGCGIKMYRGLTGQSGGSKKKSRNKGGSTMENLSPNSGIDAFITRGGNGTRFEGLSKSELLTMRGGDGYGMTTNSAQTQAHTGSPEGTGMGFHNSAGVPITGYKSCGITPDFKLGAGTTYTGTKSIQKGAGTSIDIQNHDRSSKYGYSKASPGGNGKFAGSYAPFSNISRSQKCGGSRKRKGGSPFKRLYSEFKNASNSLTNESLMSDKVGGRKTRTKRKRNKRNKRKSNKRKSNKRNKRKSNKRKSKRNKRKKHKKRRTKRKQRGGYAQYGSNLPLTRTMHVPAGPSGGSWEGQLSSPPTFSSSDSCNNNYNHFTGKNSPAPVLDQGVRQ
jgi:hypothetical protein